MPRFKDEWVVHKTLFDFLLGGSCACCGNKALFDSDLKTLIDQCTDLETDTASAELQAAENSPWPPDMRNEVWAGRVKLRMRMKRERKAYREFFEQYTPEAIQSFLCDELGVDGLRKIFQLPRSMISETLRDQYGIPKHCAYGALMTTVCEQVAHYSDTKYGTEGHGPEERDFEEILTYDKRGGFVLEFDQESLSEACRIVVARMVSLGGAKLLTRHTKNGNSTNANEDDDDGDEDDDDTDGVGKEIVAQGPSFRSDRRMIRLMIAKHWADLIMEKWKKRKGQQQETDAEIKDNIDAL